MAAWIQMLLGTNVGLGPGRVVLHGDQLRLPNGIIYDMLSDVNPHYLT